MHIFISSIAFASIISTTWANKKLCKVPEVPNGKVQRLVPGNVTNIQEFKKVPVGTELDDKEVLWLLCEKGYSALGQGDWLAKVSCNGGKWSVEPFCEPVSAACIVPEVPNGNIGRYVELRHRNLIYFKEIPAGATLEDDEEICLQCEHGYDAVGVGHEEARISCGRADCLNIYCKPASCKSKGPSTKNGVITREFYDHGDNVSYECLPGFDKVRPENVTCDHGQWKGLPALCMEKISCGEPPSIEFARINSLFPKDYHLGAIVSYECQPGYVIKGRTTISTCVTSENGLHGVWTEVPMSCADENLPSFSTTTVFPDFQSTTETSELTSFQTNEPETQPEHTTSEISTEATICNCTYNYRNENVLAYANGKKLSFGSQVKKGDKATITCLDEMAILIWNNGLSASGSVDVTCDTCESWSDGDIPFCIRPRFRSSKGRCFVEHLNYSGIQRPRKMLYEHGESFPIVCSLGYRPTLEKKSQFKCENGKWEGPSIPCAEDKNPSIFSTTTVFPDFTSTTETSELSSLPANESETQPELTTSETSTEASICNCTYNYINKKVLAYANGKKLSFGSQVKKGDKATIACLDEMDILIWNNGSRASGSVDITCDRCESWSDGVIPQCEPFNEEITCGEPPSIEFARVKSLFLKDYHLGAIVSYECQPGYVIKGRSTISECVMSENGLHGVWTKVPMSCADENPSIFSTTTVFPDFTSTTETSEISSLPTDESGTQPELTTSETSTEATICNCTYNYMNENVLAYANGKKLSFGSQVKKGDKATIACLDEMDTLIWNNGSRASGSVDITCDTCESWSDGYIPQCEPFNEEITCGEPPPIEFARVNSLFLKDYHLGAIVSYECQPGYVIKGRTTISKCVRSENGLHGVWTEVPMSCSDENPSIFSTTTVFPDFQSTTETSELSSLPTDESGTQTERTTSETSTEATEAYFCNCTYNYMNKNVLVYANGKKLSFGSQVKKGDKATITCLDEMDILIWNNGLRASGSVDITCDTCESWSDGDIPHCEPFHEVGNPSIFSTTTVFPDFQSTTETSELSSLPTSETETQPELTTSQMSTEASICKCTYNYMNGNVLAYANGKKLSFGSQVKKGDKATITCLDEMDILIWNSGLRASGLVEITCDTCQSWSYGDIPYCIHIVH